MTKIAATIFTGFLGAGKTGLIRALASQNHGRRLAFVINEFGDLGIDGEMLASCGIEGCDDESGGIIELANGCICCTVADDFLPAMESILARDPKPEHIIIETSGLALPKPLVKAFNWPGIKPFVSVDGVIAVVDGFALSEGFLTREREKIQNLRENDPSLEHESPIEELFEEQLQCADLVVISKTDLLDNTQTDAVKQMLTPFLRRATKIVTSGENTPAPVEVLLGIAAAAQDDLDTRPSHHDDGHEHNHQDFFSFSVRLGVLAPHTDIAGIISALVAEYPILRVKGFIAYHGFERRELLQAVGAAVNRHFDRPWQPDDKRETILVFIGEADLPQDEICKKLQAMTRQAA